MIATKGPGSHLLDGQYEEPVRIVAFNTAKAGRVT